MKIIVAHSPDSDDAFMHYGLASGKVPTDGIEFDHLLADIETLNRAALGGVPEKFGIGKHHAAETNRIDPPKPHDSLRDLRKSRSAAETGSSTSDSET